MVAVATILMLSRNQTGLNKTNKMAKTKQVAKSNIPTAETLGDKLGVPAVLPGAASHNFLAGIVTSEVNIAKVRVKRLTLPPIVPPAKVGVGVAIEGTIERVIPSPKAQYKSELLVMRHPSGQEFCWPVNAVTLGALANAQGVKRDAVDLQKSVGLHIIIKGMGSKPMEGKDSEGKPRTVNLYEIFVVED